MFKLEDKIVIITRPTRMQGLVEQFGTPGQAEFYLERAMQIEAAPLAAAAAPGAAREILAKASKRAQADFDMLAEERDQYTEIIDQLRRDLNLGLKVQVLDRKYLPTFVFGPRDIIVTVGQDGLVANTAKYVGNRPIVAINPNPDLFDGVLMPFGVAAARGAVRSVLDGKAKYREVTMGQVSLADGRKLLAFNDFFVGVKSHVSARYRITFNGQSEPHSSSGVLISTGAGSTGWLSSIFNMAAGVGALLGNEAKSPPLRMNWEDPRLAFVVREPFVSRQSAASIVTGLIEPGKELVIESTMSADGVIFSDGVEADFLNFNTGSIAHIGAAKQRARLVVS